MKDGFAENLVAFGFDFDAWSVSESEQCILKSFEDELPSAMLIYELMVERKIIVRTVGSGDAQGVAGNRLTPRPNRFRVVVAINFVANLSCIF